MTAASRRNLLVLAIGLEKLLLLQDVPVALAYQQALSLGKEQAYKALDEATGGHPAEFVVGKYWHELYGTELALGCLVAAYLAWRKRIAW